MLEYEVYSQTLEPYLGAVVCVTKEDADKLAAACEQKSGIGFFVREVEKGKRPIPPVADVPTPVLVDEIRRLMSIHGQNIIVTAAWNSKTNILNIATAGSDAVFSEGAYKLGTAIAKVAGYDPAQQTAHEDRRHEHPGSPAS